MKFDYLSPALGPVIDGLESDEKIYALEQSAYLPIRTLPGQKGDSAIYRCELTPEQRKMVAEGADVLVEILHCGGPLAPSRVMLLDQSEFAADETTALTTKAAVVSGAQADWLRAQLKIRKREKS